MLNKMGVLVHDGGRKYAVVVRTLDLGFLLALLGLVVALLAPTIAQWVAGIVGAFGILGSASIMAYQGANAAKDWKNPTGAVDPTASQPQQRPSGVVKVSDE